MSKRKKKIFLIQFSFLVLGLIIIFFTYKEKNISGSDKIVPENKQIEVKKKLLDKSQKGDVFYNIEYSGLDLSGNRYVLRSEEAFTVKDNTELIKLKLVKAFFYLKDDTVLTVNSKAGIYNNKSLDMIFTDNVSAFYEGSELYAERAEYSNQKSFLMISDNVIVNDARGRVFADKLLFNIKDQTLNISSIDNRKVNTKLNLK